MQLDDFNKLLLICFWTTLHWIFIGNRKPQSYLDLYFVLWDCSLFSLCINFSTHEQETGQAAVSGVKVDRMGFVNSIPAPLAAVPSTPYRWYRSSNRVPSLANPSNLCSWVVVQLWALKTSLLSSQKEGKWSLPLPFPQVGRGQSFCLHLSWLPF